MSAELLSTIVILIGLCVDAVGAIILIKTSSISLAFIMKLINQTTNEKVEKIKESFLEKEKELATLGLFLLLGGFLIQIIGYAIPFIQGMIK